MRKEIFRMDRDEALALLARAPVVHLASTNDDGEAVLRALNAVVVRGGIAFHAAPVGEKTEVIGRPAVVTAEEIVASIPSYFVDPERACPATTLYRSAQVHGVVTRVDDPDRKAEVLGALMAKYQPEGGHVAIDAKNPLYTKAIAGLMVAEVRLDHVDGKAKLAQNRSPEERSKMLERLWERGLPGDPAAIELIRAANPKTPGPAFRAASPRASEATLVCAPGALDADDAAELVVDAYWNTEMTRDAIVRAHLGSSAWVAARAPNGRLCATARAIGDGAKRAWIYDVMVAPAWRGRGLGDGLLRLLLDHPAVRHTRRVYLTTRDAQGFYSRLGFGDRETLETRRRPYGATEMILFHAGRSGETKASTAA
jgi:nitroimidazol reductase NimA-like FMN-containing flavoprotein (pyridoxamine 5'-phosphate oxidase superfamily)/GNAT superfamily N-acetyltransferase